MQATAERTDGRRLAPGECLDAYDGARFRIFIDGVEHCETVYKVTSVGAWVFVFEYVMDDRGLVVLEPTDCVGRAHALYREDRVTVQSLGTR